jgi:radical SAM superfamily enzyme YgiQ (UPF0313 family)
VTDVLLTHSYHLYYDRKQSRKMQPYPPLATLYAASVLRQAGMSVAVFDTMLEDPERGFPLALAEHRPRIVVVYEDDFNFLSKMCLTRMRDVAWQMAEQARAAGAITVAHGSDATDHTAEYLCHAFDWVVLGDAEYSLENLCRQLLHNHNPHLGNGVAFLEHGTGSLSRTPSARPRTDLDRFPSPARDLINFGSYREHWRSAHGFFSLNLIASRGCPFRCNWCAKPIFGDTFALRDPSAVAHEVAELTRLYGADHIWFADDIFALNRHWTSTFANEIERLNCKVPFKIQTRADLVTPENAESLRRAGCAEVWMGVESGSQKLLDAMDKGLKVEQTIAARAELGGQGIKACYFLQFGYPGETWDDILKTVELVRQTRPDDIGVSFSYPLINTRFYSRVKEQLGEKRNWTDSDDLCVMFKGAYTDAFYRMIRDALHAEVNSLNGTGPFLSYSNISHLWTCIETAEPLNRNVDATVLPPFDGESTEQCVSSAMTNLIPLVALGGTMEQR